MEEERASGANEHRLIEHPETSNLEEERASGANEHRLIGHPNLEEERTSRANERRLTERQESVEISNSEDEGTSASEECICIEKQEDPETSNSEGERTSAYKVVETHKNLMNHLVLKKKEHSQIMSTDLLKDRNLLKLLNQQALK